MLCSRSYNLEKINVKAPLECMLGETLQLCKKDGTTLSCEHVSSNPNPISRLLIFGPNKEYTMDTAH